MNRSSTSLQFLAASMSSHTPYRGGRNQWRRGFSDRRSGDESDQFVTGDSHFRSVRDANRGFRPVERGNFANHTVFRPQPPPHFNPNPSFNQYQPYPPTPQFQPNFNQNQQFGPPFGPPPPWTQNQQFRPPPQFRPRPPKPLDYRNWEFAKPGPPPNSERFTVLSYNILADYLAINHRSKLYFHIPRHILDWEWRKRSIIFELGLWSADILCFQEVDRFQDLEEELKLRGYSGIWKMRTGDPVDGCAMFWRVSRFKLLHEECVEYNKLGLRDNVVQICVLESVNQNNDKFASAFPTSSRGPNKVVICNIHVLYNPKRGEIKLGQIRVLLERANAASKLWDDAPIVLCGDFNCTPKSPLYNYISERKLNFSELSRDKVSGQASAEIRAPRQFGPYYGPQSVSNSVRGPTMVEGRAVEQTDSLLNVQKQNGPFSCVEESPSSFDKESGLLVDNTKVKTHEDSNIETRSVDIYSNVIKTGHGEEVDATIDANDGSSSELPQLNLSVENEGVNHDKGGLSFVCDNLSKDAIVDPMPPNDKGSPSSSCKDNVSYELTNFDFVVEEKMENLSLNELVEVKKEDENLGEDFTTFLSELHDMDSAPFPAEFSEFVKSDISESVESSKECAEVLDDDSFGIDDSVPVDTLRTTYDPSMWTPMEIEAATGKADCTLMEHPLKLRSSYVEVEDCSGARDSNGEPVVTSYNRLFLGTVDYIWRSEGLQTVKVLAPIPKHAMQWTPGFPTKKWGSDHIALVSELAFTGNVGGENPEAE